MRNTKLLMATLLVALFVGVSGCKPGACVRCDIQDAEAGHAGSGTPK